MTGVYRTRAFAAALPPKPARALDDWACLLPLALAGGSRCLVALWNGEVWGSEPTLALLALLACIAGVGRQRRPARD